MNKTEIKLYYCFVIDHRNYHYFIPVTLREQFENIIEEIQNGNLKILREFQKIFSKYQSMAPCNYMFTERTVRRDS